ncbi:MAG: hypothetical protein RSA84_24065 [Acinetobacter sp.]
MNVDQPTSFSNEALDDDPGAMWQDGEWRTWNATHKWRVNAA